MTFSFEHEKKSRIDLFTTTIMQDLSLSSTMKEKADIRDYGKLKVGLLRNEHVFLLKAISNREGIHTRYGFIGYRQFKHTL